MQVKDVIQKTTQFFKDKGFASPRLDTELLIAHALHWERMKLYLNYDYPLSEEELKACRELVRRRSQGEPVAYILGHKDFYNHSFKVTPDVLIPRPETEMIVEETLKWVKSLQDKTDFRFIDFGTGSGCIGLSILSELLSEDISVTMASTLLAVDASEGAIAVASENARALEIDDRAQFLVRDIAELSTGDVMNALGGLADAVVANPPYIAIDDPLVEENVKRFEPSSALFSGEDGIHHIRVWAMKAAELTSPDALVIFEIGASQGSAAREIFQSLKHFRNIEIIRDLSGKDRFVRCYRLPGEYNG